MKSGFYSSEDENRIFVVFGGKIGVGLGRNKKCKSVSLLLQELEREHEVGEKEPEKFDKNKPTIQLLFKDSKSIDVVVKNLLEAKKQLEEICTNRMS